MSLADFQKWWALCCLHFKKRIVNRKPICRISKLALAPLLGVLQKLSVQLQEICYPIGVKDLNYAGLKTFPKFNLRTFPTIPLKVEY
jgi:hypothetical protein